MLLGIFALTERSVHAYGKITTCRSECARLTQCGPCSLSNTIIPPEALEHQC